MLDRLRTCASLAMASTKQKNVPVACGRRYQSYTQASLGSLEKNGTFIVAPLEASSMCPIVLRFVLGI